MMFLRARRPLSVLLALMLGLALGCAGWAPRHEEENPVPRSGTLSRAWVGPESVCLELLDRGILYYFEASSTQNTHGTESRPFGRTLWLRRVAKERWQERTAHLRPAAVASSEEWARFRDLVARELLPPGAWRGVTISVGDRKIYVVSTGRRKDRALCLTEAPPGCEFIQHYDVRELKGLCVRAFSSWSGRPLGQCSPTVFQTGEQGSGAFPFVCVLPCEGDALTIAFEQKKPDPPRRWEDVGRRILSTLNLVSVITYSHTISVINHPVSAPTRFLVRLRDSVENKFERIVLKLREFPELERIPIPDLSGESARMDLAAFESDLDEIRVEEPLDGFWRRADGRSDPIAKQLELPRRHIRELPRHGVVGFEVVAHAVRQLLGEPREVHPRAQPGQDAARVVIAVVNPGLVEVRGALQRLELPLQHGYPGVAGAPQVQREKAAEEPTSDHNGVVVVRVRHWTEAHRLGRAQRLAHPRPAAVRRHHFLASASLTPRSRHQSRSVFQSWRGASTSTLVWPVSVPWTNFTGTSRILKPRAVAFA